MAANKVVGFRVDPHLKAKLEDMARHDYTSYGAIIRALIAREYDRRMAEEKSN